MQQDLWQLRHQKRWTINQLAAESDVPGLSIYEYEQGQPVRGADLPKLAQALEVDEEAIKIQSTPRPRKPRARPKSDAPRKKPASSPVRPTQIQHLVALAQKLGETREDLEGKIGQPLENLDKKEASHWLNQYTERIKARREGIADDPMGTKRWRAHLPEGVDSFELGYLQRHQQARTELTFTLFDEGRFTGRIVGFSPYNITIRTNDRQEVTLQKLAIAYYVATIPDEEEE